MVKKKIKIEGYFNFLNILDSYAFFFLPLSPLIFCGILFSETLRGGSVIMHYNIKIKLQL